MAQYSGFLNSSDVKKWRYNDLDFALMLSFFTGGKGIVAGYGNELEAVSGEEATELGEGSTSAVEVKTGASWLGDPAGWWYVNSEKTFVDVPLIVDTDINRVDIVAVKLNRHSLELTLEIGIISGTPAVAPESPVVPSITQGNMLMEDDIYVLPLAQVNVTGGSTTLTIIDLRESAECGKIYLGEKLQSNYPFILQSNISETADFTLSMIHINAFVKCSSGSEITVTVPDNSSVAFPVCTDITLWQEGAGKITVYPAGGVTIYADGYAHDETTESFSSSAKYCALTLRKIGTDSWAAIGALSTNEV